MYDPLALDRQRIELERLRRRAENAPRRPDATPRPHLSHGRTDAFLRLRRHHQPAATC